MESYENVPPGRLRATRLAIWIWAGSPKHWPGPDVKDLPTGKAKVFLKARNAIFLWTDEELITVIREKTGLTAGQVLRLVRRCLQLNPVCFNGCAGSCQSAGRHSTAGSRTSSPLHCRRCIRCCCAAKDIVHRVLHKSAVELFLMST